MQRAAQPVNFVGANAFAALDTAKGKKKKAPKDADDKDKKSSQSQPAASTNVTDALPAPFGGTEGKFTSTNWADEESDDDFAMAPMADWVQDHVVEQAAAKSAHARQKEVEAEEVDMDIEAELGIELGHDNESDEEEDDEREGIASHLQSRNVSEVTTSKRPEPEVKEEDRQLSKKELKKREMEAMAAVLAELGIAAPEDSVTENDLNGVPKKKKKEKQLKQPDDLTQAPDKGAKVLPTPAENNYLIKTQKRMVAIQEIVDDGPVELVDPAQAKKLLAAKAAAAAAKKKSLNPAMTKAATEEAKKRAKKAAAGGSKDKKKNYNQAPR